ncbi:MAG: hypothetical protein ACKV2O_01270 [Acidimicrobiales bacterium]
MMVELGISGVQRGRKQFTATDPNKLWVAPAWRRNLTGNSVHHSNAGSQFTSIRYTDRLDTAGLNAFIGTVGDSYDNAMAEALNGTLKAELVTLRGPWRTHWTVNPTLPTTQDTNKPALHQSWATSLTRHARSYDKIRTMNTVRWPAITLHEFQECSVDCSGPGVAIGKLLACRRALLQHSKSSWLMSAMVVVTHLGWGKCSK